MTGSTLSRGELRAHIAACAGNSQGPHQHVVSYHHVIHSLRQNPMALMGLTYRDQLFPRQAFRGLFDRVLEQTSDKQACRMIVDLLWHWPTTVAVAVKLNWRPGSRKTCVRNKYPISQLYVRACPVRWWIAQSRGPSRRVGSLQQSAVCLDCDARARRRAADRLSTPPPATPWR